MAKEAIDLALDRYAEIERRYPGLRPCRPGESGQSRVKPHVLGDKDLHSIARDYTPRALELLWRMANDKKIGAEIRRRCLNDILDRGWGKPSKSLTVQANISEPHATDTAHLAISREMESALGEDHGTFLQDHNVIEGDFVARAPVSPAETGPDFPAGYHTGSLAGYPAASGGVSRPILGPGDTSPGSDASERLGTRVAPAKNLSSAMPDIPEFLRRQG